MKIGDKVMLKETSKWNNGNFNNPLNTEGVIIDTYPMGGFDWKVRWGKDTTNTYRTDDLFLVVEEKSMIGKISGADWSKAPESATHVNKSRKVNFYSKGDRGWLCYFDESPSTFLSGDFLDKDSLTGRSDYLLVSKEDDLGIIQSNTEPKSEWKIRHIKSDNYKSGRDAAITILYKEIGEGYYEYKFAICSPDDMFSRKKGVEEALKKDSDKLYNEGSVPFMALILMHISISRKLSNEVEALVMSKIIEYINN